MLLIYRSEEQNRTARRGSGDIPEHLAHASVEARGRSVWTPRDTPEPGLRIAFVADPDGSHVELLSSDEKAPPTWGIEHAAAA